MGCFSSDNRYAEGKITNMTISAVILTKNEEVNIQACIQSVSWCNEIIVVDDNSTDNTEKIAKKLGAIVYTKSLDNDFAKQRNFGLEKATSDWVLFLDADERVSSTLAFEIQGKISEPMDNYAGYYMKRLDSMWGRTLVFGETGNSILLRLAKKDSGVWKGKVHETWVVEGRVGELNNVLLHFPHPTLTSFLEEINFYTTLRAEELFEKKVTVSWWQILFYPKAKFFVNYVVRRGWQDGIPGLLLAVIMSLHSFLVRAKLWTLWHRK